MNFNEEILKNNDSFKKIIGLLKVIKKYNDKLQTYFKFKIFTEIEQEDENIIYRRDASKGIEIVINDKNILEVRFVVYDSYENSLELIDYYLVCNINILEFDNENNFINAVKEIFYREYDDFTKKEEEKAKEIYKDIELFREMAVYYDEIKEA